MKKILESKMIKSLLFLLLNLFITGVFVSIGIDTINKSQEEAKEIKLVTGIIKIGTVIEEFDGNAKELSSEGGGQTVTSSISETSSSLTIGSQNSSLQSSSYSPAPNYAALTGLNLRLGEGDSFNPLVDLEIKATDKDGADITNKVKIVSNSVNMDQSGYYSVVARVKLQDNTELTQIFSVEVIAKPLRVNVSNISLVQNEVEPSKSVSIKFNVGSSKSSVIPISANVNGIDYPIIKYSTTEFSVEFMAPSESRVETIALNSIQMSDGSIIAVNHKMKLTVLKQMPIVEKLSQTVNSNNGKTVIKLQLSDKDSVLESGKTIAVRLYDENYQEVAHEEISPNNSWNNVFIIPKNGKYYLKVFGSVNCNYTNSYEWTPLYEEELVIDSIDKTTLEGENISIKEGDSFDAIRDLKLKATNENGEDITSQISIEDNVDTKTPGEYEVKASILKSNGQLVQKIFKVTVQAIETQVIVERFETQQSIVASGTEFALNLVIILSKDYVEVDSVFINGTEYVVEKLETDSDSNQTTYQVLMGAPQAIGTYELELSKLLLSNGEELMVNKKVTINLTKIVMYNELLVFMNDEELANQNINSQRSIYSTRSGQVVEILETQKTSELEIIGQVANKQGGLPEQITVTMPTVANFMVNENGEFMAPNNMKIINDSNIGIGVSVVSFSDPTPATGNGITVIAEDVLGGDEGQYDRSFVSLTLTTTGGNNGKQVQLTTSTSNVDLVSVGAKNNVLLNLIGNVGEAADHAEDIIGKNADNISANGATDTFKLTFNITRQ